MQTLIALGMETADDAIALVRAVMARNGQEAARLLAAAEDQEGLAAALALLFGYLSESVPAHLLDQYLSHARRALQNRVLDSASEEELRSGGADGS